MRSLTDFKDHSPARYVGNAHYGYTFHEVLHNTFTLPIARLTCMGHMGILDILGQRPLYELVTSAKPLSLLVAFIPTFLQLICDVRDMNKQFFVRNESLDALQTSWDYAWAWADELEPYANYVVAHQLFINTHPPYECLEDFPRVPWHLSVPVGFVWNKPTEDTDEPLLWKQLHAYQLHTFTDLACMIDSVEALPEAQQVLLNGNYFATDEAQQQEPLLLCATFEGDAPPFPGEDDRESYKWEDVFPGPPPCPDNFDILDNAMRQLYMISYYQPDGTFMTAAEQRVVDTGPIPTENTDRLTSLQPDVHMASPTWGDNPQPTETSGSTSRSNIDRDNWWEGLPNQASLPTMVHPDSIQTHADYEPCPRPQGCPQDPCMGPNRIAGVLEEDQHWQPREEDPPSPILLNIAPALETPQPMTMKYFYMAGEAILPPRPQIVGRTPFVNAADGSWQVVPIIQLGTPMDRPDHLQPHNRAKLKMAHTGTSGSRCQAICSEVRHDQYRSTQDSDEDLYPDTRRGHSSRR
ncbi:hypothetical protein BS47DRAFT_1369371 [Hydnum rufescens UP504]|uniref:Uncharacterized protein n=1 Tax=Hydnum rufescens UP504 TaxID=1448309 RepID=A0A9P6AEC6_9AGAM|nr:hypothetical protein BS47DRAFT_1369371 [Hydnum rufescens UP504]